MRNLQQNSDAVARFARRVLTCAVFQLFNYGKCIVYNTVAFFAVNPYYGSDTAGIVFKLLSVKSVFGHYNSPVTQKIKKRPQRELYPFMSAFALSI